jgi:pimeloyl-ACP methyl ester carboxylesterase
MLMIRPIINSLTLIASVILVVSFGWVQPLSAQQHCDSGIQQSGCVYILPGGAFGVFSTGLKNLAERLKKSGYPVCMGGGPGTWREFTPRIVEESSRGGTVNPIVIVGHSWGGTAALLMAEDLREQGVRVDLIATFDPVDGIEVGANVGRVLNFYVKGGSYA